MSQPSKPDGSDPRVVTPDADEPQVTIAKGYSTGKVYHTSSTCPTIKRMDAPQEVALSVAEWKDYDKCGRCDAQESADADSPTGDFDKIPKYASLLGRVTPSVCVAIRAALVAGASKREAGERFGVSHSTVERHTDGCGCDHDAPPVAYAPGLTWHPTDDASLPIPHPDGRRRVTPAACARIRQTLAKTAARSAALATLYGLDTTTVRLHATGECHHDHDAPTVAYDSHDTAWEVATDGHGGE